MYRIPQKLDISWLDVKRFYLLWKQIHIMLSACLAVASMQMLKSKRLLIQYRLRLHTCRCNGHPPVNLGWPGVPWSRGWLVLLDPLPNAYHPLYLILSLSTNCPKEGTLLSLRQLINASTNVWWNSNQMQANCSRQCLQSTHNKWKMKYANKQYG